MTKVIFRFDTEDFVNEKAADGILRAIDVLEEFGVRGCFAVTGKLIPALRKWGREDVIEALSRHEIGTHTLGHSEHPTVNEYTDIEDFDEAMRRFNERETECIRILKDAFGLDKIPFATAPGNSVSYLIHYGYERLGIPVHLGCGAYYGDLNRKRPTRYANVNILPSFLAIDDLDTYTRERLDDLIENELPRYEHYLFVHHPAMNMLSVFYDKLNFFGTNTPEDAWVMSPEKTPEAQARWIENFRYLVGKIASDPRFTTVTSDDLRDNYFTEERRVTLDTLMAVKPQIDEELFPVTLPESLALTDILYACRDLLLGKKEHLCERIYGFLDTPYATDAPVTLTREALVAMAKQIPDGFLPTALTYGDTVIGPADFLRAALTLLTEEKEEVTVLPGPWQVDLDQFPISRDLDLAGTWMHSPDFKDEFVSKRIRLQLWTVSLPRGTERKIY